ncbi:MAG TPA: ABC transporter permease subunit [Flavisolibacter sp.]|nr:ABC transporter permease subunit [Flavisolibacter sp.]
MLINKYWLETRNRFFIGLLFIAALCMFFVLAQPWILERWRMDEIKDPKIYNPPWLLIAKDNYSYFIWHFLYNYMLQFTWAIFTLMLALGGLNYEHERGSALFTLSLPIARGKLFFQRMMIGFLEASLLALLPVIIIPLFSKFIGIPYTLNNALQHSILFIAGGTVYYGLGLLINAIIKTETVAFFIGIGLIILFYFLFQPYSEGMDKPFYLSLIDLPGFIAGKATPLLFTMEWWKGFGLCLGMSLLLLFISYRITLKRDF